MGVFWTSVVFAAGGLFGFALKNQSHAALTARQNLLLEQLSHEINKVLGMNRQLVVENEKLMQINANLRTKLW